MLLTDRKSDAVVPAHAGVIPAAAEVHADIDRGSRTRGGDPEELTRQK